jgi:exonuclease SbcC
MESEIRECKFMLKEIDAKTAENERKTAEYLEVKSRLEGAEKKLRLLKRAREVFHTDKGLPKYLRDKYVGQMGALLSRYFRQFNQNPAYKEVTFDRDYSIQVKSTNGVLSLTQLSGGERVQLAVALRIALIELLSPTRTLILDEPFGSLDRDHREILGETLNRMSGSWQLVVVTHVQVESINLPKLELSGY